MQLRFIRRHKSIRSFTDIDLPKFTVLTGVNGAGKSHLLEAIELGAITAENFTPRNIHNPHQYTDIRLFTWNTLVPSDTGAFSSAQIATEQSQFYSEIKQKLKDYESQFQSFIIHSGLIELRKYSSDEIIEFNERRFIDLGATSEQAAALNLQLSQLIAQADNHAIGAFVQQDPLNRGRLVSKLRENINTPLISLTQDEFINYYPKLWQPVDMFQQSFARLFTAYQRLVNQNRLYKIALAEGDDAPYLESNDFISRHGIPPWDFLNEILEAANLSFKISAPHKWDDRPYEPILTDVERNIEVKFNDLSSGEKILMSFALCVYHAYDPAKNATFPKLLLFDEIDAPLHPSMTRSLLRTIQSIIVEKYGINVILTTHSPSTVALSPEGAIHVIRKSKHITIEKVSRDAALGILTAGVPSLSVSIENRRQVFVESGHDVNYYSRIYELCRDKLNPEISLMFISSGTRGIGNCDQVVSVVSNLRNAGNTTTLGLIDWDLKKNESNGIYVIAHKSRYSIENCILDPLILAAFLLRERIVSSTDIGLASDFRYIDFGRINKLDAQHAVDAIVRTVKSSAEASEVDQGSTYEYMSGISVEVPRWFAHLQGHQYEDRLKESFPKLKRYHNEGELKLAVINHVLADFPELMPAVFHETFLRMQTPSIDA